MKKEDAKMSKRTINTAWRKVAAPLAFYIGPAASRNKSTTIL